MPGIKAKNSIARYSQRLSVGEGETPLPASPEGIHSFRRITKKLRALLTWLTTGRQPLPKSFKRLYRLAGELRNAQVVLDHIDKDQQELAAFRNWLQLRLQDLTKEWEKVYDENIIRRLRMQLRSHHYRTADEHKLKQFFRKKVKGIKTIVGSPSPPDGQLHEARKMLQQLQYVYTWSISKGLIDPGPKKELLKELSQQAGNFNDQRMALLLLDEYMQEESDDTLLRSSLRIKEEWEKSKEQLRGSLIHTLKGFVSSSSPAPQ